MINISDETKNLFFDPLRSREKSFQIRFPELDLTISDNQIISESIKLTESINTDTDYRFGLCDESQIEFEAIGLPNVKGKKLEVNLIFNDETIPYGVFKVDSCDITIMSDNVRRVIGYSETVFSSFKFNGYEDEKLSDIYSGDWDFSSLLGVYEFDVYRYMITRRVFDPAKELLKIPKKTYTEHFKGLEDWNGNYRYYKENGYTYYSDLYIEYEEYEISNDGLFKQFGNATADPWQLTDEAFRDLAIRCGISNWQNIYDFCNPQAYFDLILTYTDDLIWTRYQGSDEIFYPHLNIVDSNYNGKLKYKRPKSININISRYRDDYGLNTPNDLYIYKIVLNSNEDMLMEYDMTGISTTYVSFKNADELDVRQLLSAWLELTGQFGIYDRNRNKFRIVTLYQEESLYPTKEYQGDETIYPSDNLYPMKSCSQIYELSDIYSCCYSDDNKSQYNSVVANFTSSNGLKINVHYGETGKDEHAYDLSDNYILTHSKFDSVEDARYYLSGTYVSIKNKILSKCKMEAVGLPFVEIGDTITVITKNGAFTTALMERTLSGIKNIKDSIISL